MGGEIFRIRPNYPSGPAQYPVELVRGLSWGKAAEAWSSTPTPSSAEDKERVELYLYSPSVLSWLFYGDLYLHLYLGW